MSSVAYTYDEVGMIDSITRDGAEPVSPSITDATHDDANQELTFNGEPLAYDKSGHMISRADMKLTWNQRGQLTGVTGALGGNVRYRYDENNRTGTFISINQSPNE